MDLGKKRGRGVERSRREANCDQEALYERRIYVRNENKIRKEINMVSMYLI